MARYCLVLLSGNERQQLFMDLSCTFVSFLEIRGGPCNPVRVALNSQTAVFRNAFSKSVYFAIFLQRIVTKTFRTSIQRTSYRLCNWQSASLYIPQRRTFHYNVALFPLWSHCSSGEKRRALNLCLENSPLAFRIAKSDARSVCRHTRPNSCPAQQSKYVNILLSSSSLMISNKKKFTTVRGHLLLLTFASFKWPFSSTRHIHAPLMPVTELPANLHWFTPLTFLISRKAILPLPELLQAENVARHWVDRAVSHTSASTVEVQQDIIEHMDEYQNKHINKQRLALRQARKQGINTQEN